jgi:hypothetical protein
MGQIMKHFHHILSQGIEISCIYTFTTPKEQNTSLQGESISNIQATARFVLTLQVFHSSHAAALGTPYDHEYI